MAGRVERSFELTRACFSALTRNPQLLVFPVLSTVGALLAAASFLLPVVLWFVAHPGAHHGPESATAQLVSFVGGFAFYLATTFVTVFFNSALVYAARRTLDGETVGVGQALSFAVSRLGPIFGYALFAAVVSTVIKQIEERVGILGRIIAGIVGLAWTLATFLAIPVLVEEGTGPIETVRRSMRLFKQTWGEQALARLGFGVVGVLVTFAVVGLTVAGFYLGSTAGWALGGGVLALAVLAVVAWTLVVSTLNSVWAAALYRYATTGEVAAGFPAHHFTR